MKAEQVAELKEAFRYGLPKHHSRLARDKVGGSRPRLKFLRSCERDGMKLENCPAYVREWMDREED